MTSRLSSVAASASVDRWVLDALKAAQLQGASSPGRLDAYALARLGGPWSVMSVGRALARLEAAGLVASENAKGTVNDLARQFFLTPVRT